VAPEAERPYRNFSFLRSRCPLIPQPSVEPQLRDAALYAAATSVGLVLGVAMAVAGLIASPFALGLSALRLRST
jgi:hypothetical protein